MFRIGQFSKLAKITIKTLRYYDKIGLLKPAMIDTASSYRYYTEEQLATVRLISTYKSAGLSNDDIFKLIRENGDEHTILEYQKQVLLERKQDIEKALIFVDGLLSKDAKTSYTATIKRVESQPVYCCRGYVANAESIHDFIKACSQELKKTNPDVNPSEPDYCCVIYPDDGYRESNIFIEYAQSVDKFGKDSKILKFKELEAVTVVSVLHRGSYDLLQDAYLFAVKWASANGYVLEGEPRERYIDGSWNKSTKAEWLTELQLPVKEI